MHAAETNRRLATIARRHHGLIPVEHARAAGVSHAALQRRVANGQLERVGRGLHRLAGAPVHWHQRALAATLLAGPDALLSHRAAAALWGLDGLPPSRPEVLVPRWSRRGSRAPGRSPTHETLDLRGADRSARAGIPCTSVVRTLLDLAAVVHPHRAEQALEDALRKRLCTAPEVAHRFVQLARRGRPGIATVRALLAERTGDYVPTMSEFERRTCELLDRRGITPPVRQHPVALAGTTVRLDLAWPDVAVAVECDGLYHHGHNQRLPWDDRRQNELVLLGWLVLRFTWRQLVDDPHDLVRQVRAALAARERSRP